MTYDNGGWSEFDERMMAIKRENNLRLRLADCERDLQECAELLTSVRKKLCYGDGDPWRKKVDALLARLKERKQ